MLVAPMSDSTDPFEMLLACHGRIRLHCALLRQLVEAEAPSADQVRDAAERAHRYFTVALPLHATDEDALLAPLVAGDPALRAGFEALALEHAALGELLEVLVPLLDSLRARPDSLDAARPKLRAPALRFSELMTAHLAGEETDLFPPARALLSETARADLAGAMRARRA